MGETFIQHGHPQLPPVMWDSRELVLISPAEESEPADDVELLRVQQVQTKAPGFENHIVTVVELVDIYGEAEHRRLDRRAHRRVGDHAVFLSAPFRRDRDDWRCEIAQ